MDAHTRTIQILAAKLSQSETDHAYTSALLEAADQREQALTTRVGELEGQLKEAKKALEAAMGLPPAEAGDKAKNQV